MSEPAPILAEPACVFFTVAGYLFIYFFLPI